MNIKYLMSFFSCLLLTFSLNGQLSFEAEVDAKRVTPNTYFNVSFTLNSINGSNFIAPDLQDFSIISGPNRSLRTTIVNGKKNQLSSISYQLKPRRLGQLKIGAAKITVGGKQLQTKPITVESVKALIGKNDASEAFFLEARINHQSAYLGQQLVLDYVFFYSMDSEGVNLVNEPSYEGFHARNVREFTKEQTKTVINGKTYSSQIIKRLVLYPQQTGAITISPLSVKVNVLKKGQRRSRSIFSRPDYLRIPIMSEELTVTVNPLPTPHPDNFSNITGKYHIQLRINKRELTTDDALSIILNLVGEGDLKRVQAPVLNFPAAFDAYDPKVLREEYIDNPLGTEGIKTFEYLLIPKEVGRFIFQPRVVIFNPDSSLYQTLISSPIEVEVLPGKGGDQQSGLIAEQERVSALFSPKKVRQLYSKTDCFLGTPLFWLFFLTPIILALFLLYRYYHQKNKPDVDAVLLRQQRAQQEAVKRLDIAHQFMQNNNSKAFFNEVENALLGYITDKLQIARADLTKASVQEKLSLLGADEVQIGRFDDLIKQCEMALYAAVDNAHVMTETYEQSLALLAEMETVLA